MDILAKQNELNDLLTRYVELTKEVSKARGEESPSPVKYIDGQIEVVITFSPRQ